MAYVVRIAPRAQRDLQLLFEDVHARDAEAALKWYQELREAILTLEKLPNRCPAAPENPQLRHLLYGRKPHIYRVIYRIFEKRNQVDVLHVRHGARQDFGASDLR